MTDILEKKFNNSPEESYHKKLGKMIKKVKTETKWRDIFKIVEEAQTERKIIMKQPQLIRILKRIMPTLMHLYKINAIKYKEVPYGT